MEWKDNKCRCSWANPRMSVTYDTTTMSGGVPVYDDQKLFEMLILESFQAGLTWECVLNKQDAFRQAFDQFDPEKVCRYDEEKIAAPAE